MDDLLRKAAEDYPLKIGDGNWQAVAAQLTQQEIPAKRKRGTWKYGVCLLVLFIFLLTADLFMKQKAGTGSGPAISTGNDQSNTLNSGTIRQPTSLDPLRETNKTASSDLKQHRISPVTTFQYDGDAQLSTNSPVISRTVPWKTGTTNYTIGKNGNKPGLDMVQADTAVKASYLISIEPASTSQERKSGVYFGVIFGPELNQVKGQRLEKTGFDVGVAAGYRFNDRFAVETGLLLSRKYYYSDAKYFNMDMPGMKLLSLEGSCTVLEIPLKVRYDVLNKRNGKLYTSGGFSTYLLRKEKNNYLAMFNGREQSMVSSYKETCRYFAATVDMSIGYEHLIRKNINVRIEPYLQLPLKGIGVGTMPVRSAGVHIGLMRSIH